MKKIHFHSLDALRFFAFLKVYLLHIPIQGNFPVFSWIKEGGGMGVAFFFVLSGFLITYLLVYEKLQEGHISIKKFLIRRSLRIWPLFYLMGILVFLLPYDFKQAIGLHMVGGGYNLDWRYSFTFLENYKMLIMDNFPKTTPLSVFWSLCIEEHFYLFWLVCLFLLPVKFIFRFLVFCVLLAWAARLTEPYIFKSIIISTEDLFTNLDYFACGGMLGYCIALYYERFSKFMNSIPMWVKAGSILTIVSIIVFHIPFLPEKPKVLISVFSTTVVAILFTVLISFFLPVDSKIRIKNRFLNYLGSISYGMYIYHIIFIHCLFQYLIYKNIKIDNWYILSGFIACTLGGTFIASTISYRYFEKPFLSLRDRLTKGRELKRG